MSRPKLLFLCHTLPFPPDDGPTIRGWHFYRLLAEQFDVTALCFYRRTSRRSDQEVSDGLAAMRKLGKAEAFPIPQEWSRGRLLTDHLRSLVQGRAYTVFAYESAAFRERLAAVLAANRFDLVHVDSLDLAGYLPLLMQQRIPVACGHHNVESALLARRARTDHGALRRAYLARQATLYRREERAWCPRCALNVTVSALDADGLRAAAPGAAFVVVPNGVDVDRFVPPARTSGVVFVGPMDWAPNRDAMTWFGRQVRPLLTAPDSGSVRVIGRSSAEDRALFAPLGLDLTGYVADVLPYLSQASCVVVPLRAGGGTRFKILDAWAMGKAIVSTSLGCEGLLARDGENILIRDSAEGFAKAVDEVLRDAGLRSRLGQAARETAVGNYSWSVVGKGLLDAYVQVAVRY